MMIRQPLELLFQLTAFLISRSVWYSIVMIVFVWAAAADMWLHRACKAGMTPSSVVLACCGTAGFSTLAVGIPVCYHFSGTIATAATAATAEFTQIGMLYKVESTQWYDLAVALIALPAQWIRVCMMIIVRFIKVIFFF
eukprot:TRINITY_DN17284_c0_g2_i1.p2 TRINITY_DN17284_c0_g2~~TRINITY_DN17284_c0_g2_i1.p2  ORF type:complete len:139 (+),score=14.61 TRINITY_DN17284_c0_g2_i1:1469-1885(+)